MFLSFVVCRLVSGGEVERTLQALPAAKGSSFRTFKDREHGWVTRGDMSQAEVSRDANSAIDAVVDFFKQTL